MKEPVIVTAFWYVGRDKDCAIPRTNERYYQEFAAWARIQNRLVIYTDKISEAKIRNIRAEYSLIDKTDIIVIDNIYDVESDLYMRMERTEKAKRYKSFKYIEDAMSNNAEFDYAWLMKYWCMADVVDKKLVNEEDVIAWMDFGFNHLDNCFSNMEEFDFLWKLNKEIDKITLFSLSPIDNISSVENMQFLTDVIMGVFHLVPVKYAKELWTLVKKAIEGLIMLDCIDDDQQLLLMAYRFKPEIFNIEISDWFLPLKEYGANHLSINSDKQKNIKGNWFKGIYTQIGILRKRFIYLKKCYMAEKRNGR